MDKDIYIVSDTHGRAKELRKALFSAGLFDNHGLKDPRAYIVHVGDIANCIRDSVEGDLESLSMVGREIDQLLPGNHEIPYFDNQNKFAGFFWNAEIDAQLRELNDADLIGPCLLVGDTLVTHAGVTKSMLNPGDTAESVAMRLEDLWHTENYDHYLFRDCGRVRYGRAKIGGMLWCDFDREFEPTPFPQIVGHTPGVLRTKENAICIDTGAKFGGVPTILKVG